MECWKALCDQCSLKPPQVRGEGKSKSPLIAFVGEAPGYHEVKQGRPFVGMAGQIIRQVVDFVGIPEDAVYFTNICLCRPPENRNPAANEIKSCWPRLHAELTELEPEMIVALGAVPGRVLLPGKNLKDDHGKIYTTRLGLQGLLTYHPAATLYPKGETIFPFILSDIQKVWRILNGGQLPPELTNPNTEVILIDSEQMVGLLLKRLLDLPQGTILSFDWETTGVKAHRDVGVCLGLSWKPGTAVAVPVSIIRKYFKDEMLAVIQKFPLAGYNAIMFDSMFNRKLGLPSKVAYDGQFMHYLLDERPQKRSLENISVGLLDAPPYESEMLARYGCTKDNMLDVVPLEEIYEYCGKDADWALRLALHLKEELEHQPRLLGVYNNLLAPGAAAFAEIQSHGVWVDRIKLAEVTSEYKIKVGELEEQLKELTGDPKFNPRSHPQVQKLLWDELKLSEPELYGRASRSANKDTLKALVEVYPEEGFVPALMNYREVYTLYSRYLRGMPEFIDPDGRVRAQYHFDRTETGRLSVTDPPLHQTPRESNIRNIYSAPPGFTLIQADYSQVEMRMVAHCAGDEKLTALFVELESAGTDFHTFMASKAFGVPIDKVTKDMRQAAKSVAFGILYRMSVKGLAAMIGVGPKKAKAIIQDYEALMPGVMKFIQEIENQVRGQRYIESIFGRRRRFPFITDRNLNNLKREAVNFPIQSPASDLTLDRLIVLHDYFKEYYPEVHIVIMSHDEIVSECPTPLVGEVAPLVVKTMQTIPFETKVPFPVDLKIGKHWGVDDREEVLTA